MNSKVITVFALLFTAVFAAYPPDYYLPAICASPKVGATCSDNKNCCSSSCANNLCAKLPATLDCCKEDKDLPAPCKLAKISDPCADNSKCCTSSCDSGKCGGGSKPLDCCKKIKY